MTTKAKQERDILMDYVNDMSDEQVCKVYSVLNLSRYASKGDIIDVFCKDELDNYDSAYPIDYFRQLEDIYPDAKKGMYIFDYTNNRTFGELVNVNNIIVDKMFKFLREL